ncbi:MAG: SEC-C domain-containing protein [Planctomycetes bacterium]|nr:SEC-C domain-containing protein [Planctomycetota bacterium]MBI3833644.1 SEC-C domain-containing protein [Planctomycetota bacterium]
MPISEVASAVKREVMKLPRRIFGSRNERLLKQYRKRVPQISAHEPALRADFDERFGRRLVEERIDEVPVEEQDARRRSIRIELSADLRARGDLLRERIQPLLEQTEQWWATVTPAKRLEEFYKSEYRKRNAKFIDALDESGISSEAFALLREASRRGQNHRHFDCQLIGGRVLFEGKIAEMKTGEGKTIVCHLAAYLNVLAGRKVHIITVNDYLVKRDAEFAQPIFELLGVTVGYIQAQQDPGGREGIRQRAYGCNITYGTNSEFGFDYLRDNMKTQLDEQVQGSLDFVIVDEVDSILIDEARTPLIISGPAFDDVTRYPRANKVAEELVRRQNTWDRKVAATVAKFDGDVRNIPKLGDAMSILGYKEKKSKGAKKTPNPKEAAAEGDGKQTDADAESEVDMPTLGPDFLTDDQVEAIQIYENDVLKLPTSEQYRRFFIVQLERKQVGITHEGVTIAQELLDVGSLYSGANMEWPHLIENALRAHKTYQRDKDYVVQEGQIIIVDPFTGRLMHGRQWSDGLHQAVEAKETVRVKEETQTLATITIQNFVKLYRIKAGMTGTALTEANEFDKIYRLDVVEIPTNRPVNRLDPNDKMYRDVDGKYGAIVDEIFEVHLRGRPADPFLLADVFNKLRPILVQQNKDVSKLDESMKRFNSAEFGDKKVITFMLETYDELMGDLVHGRPVLVGTTSVENSEKLSKLLTARYGIDHEVLNAKNHAREADIVAKAGFCSVPTFGGDKRPRGHVTIATNMAGRGTDIKLGQGVVYPTCKVPEIQPAGVSLSVLFPPGVTKCCIHCEEYDPATNCAHCYKPKLDPRFPALGRQVCPTNVPCGLHIVGTERHEARRIDNQLRGRAGRQGDPGSSRFFLSLQDDLLKLFMSDWMLKMMERLGFTEGTSLEDKRLSKGIERAQRKVEESNFSRRKHLLEWDEPMDYQRKEFYTARQQILEERDLPQLIFAVIENTIQSTLKQYLSGDYNKQCIVEWCRSQLDLTIDEDSVMVGELDAAIATIREKAKDEGHDMIRTSIGEYIDPEEPPAQWDLSGLSQWAKRLFDFNVSQNQLRKMEPRDIEQALFETADAHYDSVDLSGISIYLDPQFPLRALADWAKTKFNIPVTMDDLLEKSKDDIAALFDRHVHEAYHQREIAYPVETCLERSLAGVGTDNATAADNIAMWVNAKYNLGWTPADVQGKTIDEIKSKLLDLAREFLDGRLDKEIDAAIAGNERDAAIEWAKQRMGRAWNQRLFDREEGKGDCRTAIHVIGHEMLRWELTRLEQFVLLRIYDQAWKDHLLEMDHLKTAIMQRAMGGDQTHPQSQFAIEGRDLFTQMWSRIAARVTDIVFKIRENEPGAEGDGRTPRAGAASAPRSMTFRHADSTGTGFAQATPDQQAAMRAQNVEAKVETIRREQPRVGRNDPCPCGSGKKFKQCHGKGA